MDELDLKNFTEESAELSNNDPMDEDVNNMMEDGKEGHCISFLEASDHIKTLRCFGKSIGASSEDLNLLISWFFGWPALCTEGSPVEDQEGQPHGIAGQ
jgi:hypothetical protein